MMSEAAQLRVILAEDRCHIAPRSRDALSTEMIDEAALSFTLMSRFAAPARCRLANAGLTSHAEMADQVRNICAATPVTCGGDTGHDCALNAAAG